MTLTGNRRTDVLEFFNGDEKLVQKWASTSSEDWADLGGIYITGVAKERDSGFSFGQEIARLSDTDLMEFRYALIDQFGLVSDRSEDRERTPIEEVTQGLLEVLEAEIGGRWVR